MHLDQGGSRASTVAQHLQAELVLSGGGAAALRSSREALRSSRKLVPAKHRSDLEVVCALTPGLRLPPSLVRRASTPERAHRADVAGVPQQTTQDEAEERAAHELRRQVQGALDGTASVPELADSCLESVRKSPERSLALQSLPADGTQGGAALKPASPPDVRRGAPGQPATAGSTLVQVASAATQGPHG